MITIRKTSSQNISGATAANHHQDVTYEGDIDGREFSVFIHSDAAPAWTGNMDDDDKAAILAEIEDPTIADDSDAQDAINAAQRTWFAANVFDEPTNDRTDELITEKLEVRRLLTVRHAAGDLAWDARVSEITEAVKDAMDEWRIEIEAVKEGE